MKYLAFLLATLLGYCNILYAYEKPETKEERSKKNLDVAPANRFIKVEIGKTVLFHEGIQLTFNGHSHKKTYINGPQSPLIVYISYTHNGVIFDRIQHNTFPVDNEPWGWEWKKYKFIVKSYKYNSYMQIKLVR